MRKKPWISDRTPDLADEKAKARSARGSSEDGRKRYCDLCNKTKESAKEDKEKWIRQQCSNIQRCFGERRMKEAYQLAKSVRKGHKPRNTTIKDRQGHVISDKQQVTERWAEYCEELYTDSAQYDRRVLQELKAITPPDTADEPGILLNEVEHAVKKLKNNKGVGFDGIPGELLKNGGQELTKKMYEICNWIWTNEDIPRTWTKSVIITIPKKGDIQDCSNYRTISLISHSSKILLLIILNRLRAQLHCHLSEEQAGFRANRNTIQQILTLRCHKCAVVTARVRFSLS